MRPSIRPSQLAMFALLGLSFIELSAVSAALLLILNGTLLIFSQRRESRPVPSVSLIVVAYIAGYALPVLLFPESLGKMSEGGIDRMMRWALRGFAMFSVAYSMSARGSAKSEISGTGKHERPAAFASFAYAALGFISISAWLINAMLYGVALTFMEGRNYGAGSETLRQILQLFAEMRYAYLLGYLLLRSAGKVRRVHQWILMAVLAVSIAEIILIGSKAAIIKLLVVLVLSVTLGNANRLRWKSVVVGAMAVALSLLSFGVITEYRHIVRSAGSGGQQATDIGFRYQAFRQATVASLSDNGSPRETVVDRGDIASRFGSGAVGLGWVLEFTHGISPYENPISSALAPFHAFIPRFLWEEKPIFFNSGRFASEYFGWKYGGISISLLGSLYFAWGYSGILIGMAIAGFSLATLISRVERKGFIAVNSIVCLTILMLHMLDVGAEFQPVLVNITRTLLLLVGIRIAWRVHLSRSQLPSSGNATWQR